MVKGTSGEESWSEDSSEDFNEDSSEVFKEKAHARSAAFSTTGDEDPEAMLCGRVRSTLNQ